MFLCIIHHNPTFIISTVPVRMASSLLQYQLSLSSYSSIDQISILYDPEKEFCHYSLLLFIPAFVISTIVPVSLNSAPPELGLLGADGIENAAGYNPDSNSPPQNENEPSDNDVAASDGQVTGLVAKDDSSHEATNLVTNHNGKPNLQVLLDNSIAKDSDYQRDSVHNGGDRSCNSPNLAQNVPEIPGLPFIGTPDNPNAQGTELLAPILQLLGIPKQRNVHKKKGLSKAMAVCELLNENPRRSKHLP